MNDSVITFSGWVGSPVDLVELREGLQVATFRVGSTPRRMREGRWEDGETVWYSVKVWRALAANVAESLRSGDPVVVTGRFTTETWTKEDGSAGARQVVVAHSVGHDLNRGTSAFLRTAPATRTVPGAPATGSSAGGGDDPFAVPPATPADDQRAAAAGQEPGRAPVGTAA